MKAERVMLLPASNLGDAAEAEDVERGRHTCLRLVGSERRMEDEARVAVAECVGMATTIGWS
jgi:hypothetical protein